MKWKQTTEPEQSAEDGGRTEPFVSRGPVKDDRISVQLRCLVQRNGDGTVTVTVPRLSTRAWTGQTEAEARMMALLALVDGA